ncbi:uncharacterized protein LOC118193888 [Stegodyphus dumicola]|uniref:uncharacterized protein LOC118193888 n=1 Tax=Stegodyphus dumicola TaxID=202533 RepID=UPI0015B29CE1|nr:uncharacterized protein LOC118193888 [Stegodyphus dumicola]
MNDPDKLKSAQAKKEEDKSFLKKLGLSGSKSSATPTKTSTPAGNSTKNENKAHTVVAKPGKFEDECLRAHNEYRAKHGVPSLTLSKEICSYAKEWADHLAATDRFEHRRERKYGENIFMKWSSDPNHVVAGNEAVDSWYSEIKDHTFGVEPRSLKSGHFTQVIWKESKHMGVAWARSKSGKILVVANYDPAGNFIGKFSENVPPPKMCPQKEVSQQSRQPETPTTSQDNPSITAINMIHDKSSSSLQRISVLRFGKMMSSVTYSSGFRSQYGNLLNVSNHLYTEQKSDLIEKGDDFALECLRSHNRYRAQHGCPPLHLSAEVSAFSQEWADKLAREDRMYHSHNPKYGENLFVTYMSDNSRPMAKGTEVVDSWYSEHVFYPYSGQVTREIVMKAGHFTQVIWRNSKEMGIGKAVSRRNRIYVVANYYPAGNVLNKFTDNVPRKMHTSYDSRRYSRRIFTRTLDFQHQVSYHN